MKEKEIKMPDEVLEQFREWGREGGLKGGSAGGKIGGKRRKRALSKAERVEIAKKAAAARWGKQRDSK